MSFSIWTKYFHNNAVRIPAAFLNKVRHELARAIDAGEGGHYSPIIALVVTGAGMKLGNILDGWFAGIFTRSSTFRRALRVERHAPTSDDIQALATNIVDIVSIDGSGIAAPRIVELQVTEAMRTGLVVRVVMGPVSPTHVLDITSAGSNLNPIFTLAAGGTAPWCMLWFDQSLVDGNALGTWRPFAHGQA